MPQRFVSKSYPDRRALFFGLFPSRSCSGLIDLELSVAHDSLLGRDREPYDADGEADKPESGLRFTVRAL